MNVIKRVCFEYDVSIEDVFKRTLSNKASLARKVIIYFLYMSKDGKEIQEELKIKSLSSVFNSIIWVRDNISLDKDLQNKISRIQRDVRRS